jgi:ABC-type Zn uptake system ZnuABC Zn-binding protein ZnuA
MTDIAYHLREIALVRAPLLLALSLAVILGAGCGDDDDSANGGDRVRVVATTTQIGDFARNVGGDLIHLDVLFHPNQDAHDFEPSPSQIRALSEADIVLRNGIGLDTFINRGLESSDADNVVVTNGIALREGMHDEERDERDEAAEDEASGHDPHVWLSVANAKLMVENVRDALGAADPANAAAYAANAGAYLAELDALDAAIARQVADIPERCRKLVTNHEVLGYYADAYGFEFAGSVVPSLTSQAQPSAVDVAEIVELIREQGVPAVFAEASANPALIEQVGDEAGVTVVDDLYGDSLGTADSDGATYIGMMETNTRLIVDALRPCP